MASPAAAGFLFPGAGAPVIRTTASCRLRPAAPSHVRLAATTAPGTRARLRSAPRPTACARLWCAPSGDTAAAADLDGVTEDDLAGLPSWAPSIEELIEFENTDFSPEAIEERFIRESREATNAVKGAVAGLLLRPLWDLVDDVRKLKSVYHMEEFHIGLPVGAFMACVAVYHLYKAVPSACLDFALHYGFYRLCVMAADVRRRGFATDMIIRLKLFITMAMLVKGLVDQVAFHDHAVRFVLFAIYYMSVGFEVKGLKKYGKYLLPGIFHPIKIPEEIWGCLDTPSQIEFGIDDEDS